MAVYQLILKEACWLAALGIAGGVFCSVVVASLLRSLLFAVSPWDITTLLSVGFVLAASTLVASYIPARRAASMTPQKLSGPSSFKDRVEVGTHLSVSLKESSFSQSPHQKKRYRLVACRRLRSRSSFGSAT